MLVRTGIVIVSGMLGRGLRRGTSAGESGKGQQSNRGGDHQTLLHRDSLFNHNIFGGSIAAIKIHAGTPAGLLYY